MKTLLKSYLLLFALCSAQGMLGMHDPDPVGNDGLTESQRAHVKNEATRDQNKAIRIEEFYKRNNKEFPTDRLKVQRHDGGSYSVSHSGGTDELVDDDQSIKLRSQMQQPPGFNPAYHPDQGSVQAVPMHQQYHQAPGFDLAGAKEHLGLDPSRNHSKTEIEQAYKRKKKSLEKRREGFWSAYNAKTVVDNELNERVNSATTKLGITKTGLFSKTYSKLDIDNAVNQKIREINRNENLSESERSKQIEEILQYRNDLYDAEGYQKPTGYYDLRMEMKAEFRNQNMPLDENPAQLVIETYDRMFKEAIKTAGKKDFDSIAKEVKKQMLKELKDSDFKNAMKDADVEQVMARLHDRYANDKNLARRELYSRAYKEVHKWELRRAKLKTGTGKVILGSVITLMVLSIVAAVLYLEDPSGIDEALGIPGPNAPASSVL